MAARNSCRLASDRFYNEVDTDNVNKPNEVVLSQVVQDNWPGLLGHLAGGDL